MYTVYRMTMIYAEVRRVIVPSWIRLIPRVWRADLIAGMSVAVVAIPQSLAYAQLAGLPPVYGLYAGFLPTIVAGLTSSSAHISTGTAALISLITYASVSKIAVPFTYDYILLVSLLALLVGLFQVLFGILKLGSLIKYVALPVVSGFVSAGAIIILVSQLDDLFGVKIDSQGSIGGIVVELVSHMREIDASTLLYGVYAIAVIVAARRYMPRLPAVLLVVLTTSLVSMYTNYAGAVVGNIPIGLPSITITTHMLGSMRDLLLPSFLIAVVGYMSGYSVVKSISSKTSERVRPNQEMVSQGLSNLTASLSGTMPVAGSLSRTALNYSSGAQTGLASVVLGIATFLTLVLFAPWFYYLPQATLSAVIITSTISLVDFSHLVRLAKTYPHDGTVAMVTFCATLLFSPEIDMGIMLGIGTSILMILYRSANPPVKTIFLHNEQDIQAHDFSFPFYRTNSQVMVVVWDASSISFVNSGSFEDHLMKAVQHEPPIKYVLVLARAVNTIDASGADSLQFAITNLHKQDIALLFAGLKPSVMRVLAKTGLEECIGHENFFSHARDALNDIHRRDKKK